MLGVVVFVISGFSLLIWNSYRTARLRGRDEAGSERHQA